MQAQRKLCACCGSPFILVRTQGNWTDLVCVSCEAEAFESDGVTFAIVTDGLMREAWREGTQLSREERVRNFHEFIDALQQDEDGED